MTHQNIPDGYIQRENAEPVVGKSSKTVYRNIRDAIRTGDSDRKVMLDHCVLALNDDRVIDGREIESMKTIDDYRRAGLVPTWYIDAEWFANFFKDAAKKKSSSKLQSDTSPKRESQPAESVGMNTSTDSQSLIEQYKLRLQEKDEQIADLKQDKHVLREQLSSVTQLTDNITKLLGHSQLKALGLQTDAPTEPTSSHEPITTVVAVDPQPPKQQPKEAKVNTTSEAKKRPRRTRKKQKKKPTSILHRDVREFIPFLNR